MYTVIYIYIYINVSISTVNMYVYTSIHIYIYVIHMIHLNHDFDDGPDNFKLFEIHG